MMVNECTVEQLTEVLASRCPTLVVSCHFNEDANDKDATTMTWTSGNRAACLGLSHYLVDYSMRRMKQGTTRGTGNGDDDGN